jgi:hypothetical protein
MIQTFDPNQQLDRVTFVREHRQGTTTPERPHSTISDLLGRWKGTATTFYPHADSPIVANTDSTFTASNSAYQLVEDDDCIDLIPTGDRLWQFSDDEDGQSYQLLLLPDGGYTITPTQIGLGYPFYLEIGWIYADGKRQRLVRRYDSTGKWYGTTFISEEIDRS